MTVSMKILICAIALLVASFGLHTAISYYVDPSRLSENTTSTTPITAQVGNTQLTIPQNMIRFDSLRRNGETDRLELQLQWPSLQGYTTEHAAAFETLDDNRSLIFLTLEKTGEIYSGRRKLEGIYRRFFQGKPWRGPDGLIGQRLDPQSGYRNEDIFYGRNEQDIFVARCLQEDAAERDNVLPTCLYDFQFDPNLLVTVRISRNQLKQWRLIDNSLKRHLNSLKAN